MNNPPSITLDHQTNSIQEEEDYQSSSSTFIKVPKRKKKNHSSLNIKPMRFVVISDTHCLHSMLEIPSGDVLLHCGDFTNLGLYGEVDDFFQYLINNCDGIFKYIIMIVGRCL